MLYLCFIGEVTDNFLTYENQYGFFVLLITMVTGRADGAQRIRVWKSEWEEQGEEGNKEIGMGGGGFGAGNEF